MGVPKRGKFKSHLTELSLVEAASRTQPNASPGRPPEVIRNEGRLNAAESRTTFRTRETLVSSGDTLGGPRKRVLYPYLNAIWSFAFPNCVLIP